jgi:hypothetical protein
MSVLRCVVTLNKSEEGSAASRSQRLGFPSPPRGEGDYATPYHQHPTHHEPDRPQPPLIRQRECRFDEQRVRDQPAEAAQVRGRIQRIRVAAAAGEPRLQQRGGGAQRQERCTHRHEQHQQQVPDRCFGIRGQQRLIRLQQSAEHQHRPGDRQHCCVHQHLPADAGHLRGDDVGGEIAEKQHRLEEDEAGVPDARRAAGEGQQLLADERLHGEREGRRQQHGQGERQAGQEGDSGRTLSVRNVPHEGSAYDHHPPAAPQ